MCCKSDFESQGLNSELTRDRYNEAVNNLEEYPYMRAEYEGRG